jgi:hypothetical protein
VPNLADLRANYARVAFAYFGATFTAYYHPLDVNDSTTHARKVIAEQDDMEALYAELGRLVVEWDATEGSSPVPATAEGFRSAGVGVCLALWNALLNDLRNPTMAPGYRPASPTRSFNGSSAADAWGSAPTTTPLSSTPSGSGSRPGTSPDSPTAPVTLSGSPGPTA